MKIALAAYFLAIGLVLTAPLAKHLTDGVPYTRHAPGGETVLTNVFGDHLQLHYRLWLFGDTLLGPSHAFRNRYEFSTAPGVEAPLASYFLPFSLIFLLFSPLGPAAGYNAALLAAFVFSGLAMHALVLHYTGERSAALVGGTAFAAAPYVVSSLTSGHPIGLAAFFVPLSVLLLERLLLSPTLRAALAAGIVFVLLADNDLHVLYFVALLSPLVVALHFLSLRPRAWAGELRALAVPLLVVVGLAGAAVALKLSLMPPTGEAAGAVRSLREIATYSPRPADLLVRNHWSLPRQVYPGVAAGLTAAAGLAFAALRRRRPGDAALPLRRVLFFAALFAVALALAFGPQLPVRAPYVFLHEHLPKFSLLRQTSKLMVPAGFALAVLAGLGWAALRRALPGRRGALATAIVVAAIIADAVPYPGPGIGISLLPARVEAYERVFRDRPGSRVLNVPVLSGSDAWASHYLYYATRYRTVMVNGYHPIVPPGYVEQVYRPLAGLNDGQVLGRQHELLQRLGVEYLILHEESFPPQMSLFPPQHALENLLRSPYLEAVALEAPVAVFRVRRPGEVTAPRERFVSTAVGVAVPARFSGAGAARPDADAASGAVLTVGEGATGMLMQNRTPAGRFSLAASVRPEREEALLTLTARRKTDGTVLAERSFAERGPGYRTVGLEFALGEATSLSYELRGAGGALAVDWLALHYADRPDPPGEFELEELFHIGNAAPSGRASGGRALLLAASDPAGQATWGPYRLYAPGRYELKLSLARAGDESLPPGTAVAAVALRNHLDRIGTERDLARNVLMPERTVTADQLAGGGEFREIAFPFALARPAFLSVNLRHFQRGVLADRATVARVGE